MTATKPATPLPWDNAGSTPQQATIDKGNFCIGDCGSGSGAHQNAAYIVAACNAFPQLVAALRELHEIDERKLAASERRVYKIGHSVIQERVERNRALLRSLGESQ